MPAAGDPQTRLAILRGPSGSGKSSTARGLRAHVGRGLAWVEQDHFRRVVLRERDRPGGVAVGLIDAAARYCLDHGYHVVVEGLLYRDHYADVLTALVADHRGRTACYYFDLPFEETLRRHATRPEAAEFTPEQMRPWYRHRDLLPGELEQLVPPHATLEGTVARVIDDLGLPGQDGTGERPRLR